MKTADLQGRTRRVDRGFTLIEMLVVLALVAFLASLLSPALGRAKGKARTIACVGNLRQLGIAVRTYAEDRQGTLPAAELLPSQPVDAAHLLPRIADLLAPELGTTTQALSQVFRCPEDRRRRWEREGASYEWNTDLNGRRIDETRNAQFHVVTAIRAESGDILQTSTNGTVAFPPTTTPLLYNYDPVHPRPPRSARNAVFMDGHVDSLDTMLR